MFVSLRQREVWIIRASVLFMNASPPPPEEPEPQIHQLVRTLRRAFRTSEPASLQPAGPEPGPGPGGAMRGFGGGGEPNRAADRRRFWGPDKDRKVSRTGAVLVFVSGPSVVRFDWSCPADPAGSDESSSGCRSSCNARVRVIREALWLPGSACCVVLVRVGVTRDPKESSERLGCTVRSGPVRSLGDVVWVRLWVQNRILGWFCRKFWWRSPGPQLAIGSVQLPAPGSGSARQKGRFGSAEVGFCKEQWISYLLQVEPLFVASVALFVDSSGSDPVFTSFSNWTRFFEVPCGGLRESGIRVRLGPFRPDPSGARVQFCLRAASRTLLGGPLSRVLFRTFMDRMSERTGPQLTRTRTSRSEAVVLSRRVHFPLASAASSFL